jgi:DNA primase
MSYFEQSFIDNLLARTDIVDVVERFLTLKKQGENYWACCPFHTEKTASFSVSSRKQIYHCFGCGVGGNVLSFMMEYERLSFPEAIESLAASIGMPLPEQQSTGRRVQSETITDIYQTNFSAMRSYQKQLRAMPAAIDYLKNRGVSGEIAKRYAIGFAGDDWRGLSKEPALKHVPEKVLVDAGLQIAKPGKSAYDRFRNRLMFPIRDRRGRVLGFGGRVLTDELPKYLNSPETPAFQKSRALYGIYEALQVAREFPYLMVVEGYMDVVALAQHDIPYSVATLGTATTADHIKQLLRYTKTIVFCFDGDTAGKKAAWRALKNCFTVVPDDVIVRFLFLPDGEDPDSLVRSIGHEAFEAKISKAIPISEFLLNQCAARFDANSVQGQAQVVHFIKPLIAELKAPALRTLLLAALAKWMRVDVASLEGLLGGAPQVSEPIASDRRSGSMHRPTPIEETLLIGLLDSPERWRALSARESLLGLKHPKFRRLGTIANYLEGQPETTTARLLEHFREHDIYQDLQDLVTRASLVEDPADANLDQIVQQLLSQEYDYIVKSLLNKAKEQDLSPDEKAQLTRLIQWRKSAEQKA